MMSAEDLDNIAQHVLALSKGSEHAAGKALYESAGCGGCHGMDAKGIQMMGSANLVDAIWRFSPGTLESVKYTIANGVNAPGATETRQAIMPVFSEQLSELEIKKLAAISNFSELVAPNLINDGNKLINFTLLSVVHCCHI